MKIALFLVAVCLAITLGSAYWLKTEKRHILINRPKIDIFGARDKRSPWPWAGVKGQKTITAPPSTLEMKLRKGEYVCGNRICKLQPGEVPKGCNGVCQYRVD